MFRRRKDNRKGYYGVNTWKQLKSEDPSPSLSCYSISSSQALWTICARSKTPSVPKHWNATKICTAIELAILDILATALVTDTSITAGLIGPSVIVSSEPLFLCSCNSQALWGAFFPAFCSEAIIVAKTCVLPYCVRTVPAVAAPNVKSNKRTWKSTIARKSRSVTVSIVSKYELIGLAPRRIGKNCDRFLSCWWAVLQSCRIINDVQCIVFILHFKVPNTVVRIGFNDAVSWILAWFWMKFIGRVTCKEENCG